jgi:hypothetical protein
MTPTMTTTASIEETTVGGPRQSTPCVHFGLSNAKNVTWLSNFFFCTFPRLSVKIACYNPWVLETNKTHVKML